MKLEKGLILVIIMSIITLIISSCTTSKLKKVDDGIIFSLKEGALKIQVCTDRIIRVIFDPTGLFQLKKSLVVE